jgi:hypothetical protein
VSRWCQLVLPLLASACIKNAVQPTPEPRPTAGIIGRQVELTLPSLDGDAVSFASLRGKPAVVHFSTTGSLEAQVDVDELRRLRGARRDVQVVEVALDPTQPRLIRAWADASAIDWTVLLATPGLVAGGSAFGPIRVTPTTFLLDADGRIVWGREGYLPRGALAKVLAELDARDKKS